MAASRGHAKAQTSLGALYADGVGVAQNYREALHWYRLAAGQGEAAAQYALGLLCDTGRGVPHDSAEAVEWYSKAASQGHADAQYNLAAIYEEGDGVPRDPVDEWESTGDGKLPADLRKRMIIHNPQDLVVSLQPRSISLTESRNAA